jgi:aryl-alcohol dehydrogenase-like predicted oxidoreductase
MKQRTLGKSGVQVSLVGLGCNNFGGRIDLEASRKVVHKALDLGITLFDTADVYGERGGSETILGQVLGDRRKDIILATKFGMPIRTSTACWRGIRNASSCPQWTSMGSDYYRIFRWPPVCSPASTSGIRRCRKGRA